MAAPGSSGPERCHRCNGLATGYARINDDRYCHGNGPGLTCYEMATNALRDPVRQSPLVAEVLRKFGWTDPAETERELGARWLAGPGGRPTADDMERWARFATPRPRSMDTTTDTSLPPVTT